MPSALVRAPGKRWASWQLIEVLREDATHRSTAALTVRVVRFRPLLKQVGLERAAMRAIRVEGYQRCVPILVA